MVAIPSRSGRRLVRRIPAGLADRWLARGARRAGAVRSGRAAAGPLRSRLGLVTRRGPCAANLRGAGLAPGVPPAAAWRRWPYPVALWVDRAAHLGLGRRSPAERPLEAVGVTLLAVVYAARCLLSSSVIRHLPLRTAPGPAPGWCSSRWSSPGSAIPRRCSAARPRRPQARPHDQPRKDPLRRSLAGVVGGLVIAPIFGPLVFPPGRTRGRRSGSSWSWLASCRSWDRSATWPSPVQARGRGQGLERLIPGHGGVLDRFDSLYFVVPVAALMYRLFRVRSDARRRGAGFDRLDRPQHAGRAPAAARPFQLVALTAGTEPGPAGGPGGGVAPGYAGLAGCAGDVRWPSGPDVLVEAATHPDVDIVRQRGGWGGWARRDPRRASGGQAGRAGQQGNAGDGRATWWLRRRAPAAARSFRSTRSTARCSSVSPDGTAGSLVSILTASGGPFREWAADGSGGQRWRRRSSTRPGGWVTRSRSTARRSPTRRWS